MPNAPRSAALAASLTLSLALAACSGGSSTAGRTTVPGRGPTTTAAAPTTTSPPATTTTIAATTTSSTIPSSTPPGANGLTISRASSGAWVVGIDSSKLRLWLMPGSVEPKGGPFIHPTAATPIYRPRLVAAFNGGFKFADSQGGFSLGTKTPVPLVNGAASLVVYADGTATIGAWGRDVTMNSRVEGVLQNLQLMVDKGHITDVTDTDGHRWGTTYPKGIPSHVPRSGLCVTANNRLTWVGGMNLGAATLARTMVGAGCVRGMEMDINTDWVDFALFDHPDPTNPGTVVGHNLYPEVHHPAVNYLNGKDRNWFMLTWRS